MSFLGKASLLLVIPDIILSRYSHYRFLHLSSNEKY